MDESRGRTTLSRRDVLLRLWTWGTGLAVIDPRIARAVDSAKTVLKPTRKAQARSVIQIWLSGGPSHLDTFDPKPNAGSDYCGPLNKPISTNVAGIQIGELLPLLAQQADKYSIVRSMTHGVNAHETASYLVQTGHNPGEGLVYPCLGAVVTLFRGYDHGYQGLVPPYIALTTPLGRFSEAGFLGEQYAPFATGGDPNQKRFTVEGIVSEGLTDRRSHGRRELVRSLDTFGKTMSDNPYFRRVDECERKADETVAKAAKLFDLSQETNETRERYGRNTFGQSCLAARRLVEYGVPYVIINSPGWDTHKQHFQIMRQKLPQLDQGLANLLSDLAARGLLSSTIVWCCGEFGRTPKIDWQPPWNGGRGHFGHCFSALVAGGGFAGGHVIGATDARGEEVAQRPVYPQDLLGSIIRLLGVDPSGILPNDRGLSVQVMPAKEGGRGRLDEIM